MLRVECNGEYLKSTLHMERMGMKCVVESYPEITYHSACHGRVDRIEGLSRVSIVVQPESGITAIRVFGVKLHYLGSIDPQVIKYMQESTVLWKQYFVLKKYTKAKLPKGIGEEELFQNKAYCGNAVIPDTSVLLVKKLEVFPAGEKQSVLREFFSVLQQMYKNVIVCSDLSAPVQALRASGYTEHERTSSGEYLLISLREWQEACRLKRKTATEPYEGIDLRRTGQRIAMLLFYNGFEPQTIYSRLGLNSAQCVYRWLRGDAKLSRESLLQLAGLCEVSVEDVLVKRQRSAP